MTETTSEFMTVDETAAYMRVNRKTIYDAVKLGKFPGAQYVQGAIRIHRPTVVEWFATGEVPVKQRKRTK
jgi:excisionase family DNA binding protein